MPKKFSTKHTSFRPPTNNGSTRQEKSRRQNKGSGGSGSHRDFATKVFAIDGEEFYCPDGVPFLWERNQGDPESAEVVLRGSEFYLNIKKGDKETVAILAPFYHKNGTHSPQQIRDSTVLPKHVQGLMKKYPDSPLWKGYLCTSDVDLGNFPEFDDWEPNQKWIEGEGSWTLELSEHLRVEVYEKDGGYAVQPPELHASLIDTDFEPFFDEDHGGEAEMRALYHAEVLLHQTGTCGFCMEVQSARNLRVKNKEQKVWPVRQEIFIPMFDLRWLEAQGGGDGPSAFRRTDPEWVPEDAEFACREGWTTIRCPDAPSARSSRHRTFENYKAYTMQLFQRCGNCMEEGKEVSPDDHQIRVKSLCCKDCGAELYDTRSITRAKLTGEMEFDDYGNPIPDSAGLYEMISYATECPECGNFDVPDVELGCNTCDDPRPLGPHEVLTRVTIAPSKHYEFEVVDDYFGADEEDLQYWYSDFSEFPLFNGFEIDDPLFADVQTAYGVCLGDSGIEILHPRNLGRAFITLDPEEQLRMIGSDLVEAVQKESHSESRSPGRGSSEPRKKSQRRRKKS